MGPSKAPVSKLGFTLDETNAFYRVVLNCSNMLALDILSGVVVRDTILPLLTGDNTQELKDLERELNTKEADAKKRNDDDTAEDLNAVKVILGLHIRPTKAFKTNLTKMMRVLALLVLHQNGHPRDRTFDHDYSFARPKITMELFELYHTLFNKLHREDDPYWTEWKIKNVCKEEGQDVYYTPHGVTYEMKQLRPKAIDQRMKKHNDVCVLCDSLYNGDNPLVNPASCEHHFHDICISPWLFMRPTCPLCWKDSENQIAELEKLLSYKTLFQRFLQFSFRFPV